MNITNDENFVPVIPKQSILGLDIAAVNMEWVLDYLQTQLCKAKGQYICITNVHTLILALDTPSYKATQEGAIMALPDGAPLSKYGQYLGSKNMARVAGPSLMEEIFNDARFQSASHFFYGSDNKTLQKLINNLKSDFPTIRIAGFYSPPFRPLSSIEDKKIIELINKTNPDFVWVGLGAPKQEIWMSNHKGKIDGLMIGVGAGFDFLAGTKKRAPKWIQGLCLEWLYRLAHEPRRLFKRYAYTNVKFMRLVLQNEIQRKTHE